jgi:hypothetical protein
MSDRQPAEATAPDQLNDQDLEDIVGGLVPAVAPAAPVVTVSQPALVPAVQRTLIGLL